MTLFRKRIVGSLFGDCNPTQDIKKMLALYRSGKLKLDELVTKQLQARGDQPGLRRPRRRQEHPRRVDPRALIELLELTSEVVGLRRQAEVVAVALQEGCHVVLDGPPGTGKSTLLRAIAADSGRGMEFVEGNAELTPARLIGHHDPALVLDGGYRAGGLDRRAAGHRDAGRLAAVPGGAQPDPRGDAQRPDHRDGRARAGRPAARADRRGRRLRARRRDEPVRCDRHRAREPGDRRPHVPGRDRLPRRGGRAGGRAPPDAVPTARRSPLAVAVTRGTRDAPRGAERLLGARRDRHGPPGARARAAA